MKVEVTLTLRVDTRGRPHEDQRPVTLVKTFEMPAIFNGLHLQDDNAPEGLIVTLEGVTFRTGTGDFAAWADAGLARCHYDACRDRMLTGGWRKAGG